MENEQLAAEMAAKGLVRAQIKTLKGNTVWRWVKPDNPNIVGAVKTQLKPVVEAKEVIKKLEPAVFIEKGWPSCCGASALQQHITGNWSSLTDAEKRKKWEASSDHAHYVMYKNDAEYYQRAGNKVNFDYYMKAAEQYNFEAYDKSDGVGSAIRVSTTKSPKSPGIAACATEFPKSTQTPSGLWVRKDCEPVSKSTDDNFEPAEVVDFKKFAKKANTGTGYNALDANSLGSSDFTILSGHTGGCVDRIWRTIWRGRSLPGYSAYATQEEQKKFIEPFKPGHTVVFIMNHTQRNSAGLKTPQLLADMGFREVLRTGNTSHPGQSTIYLYERTLTEDDLAKAWW